MSIKMKLFLFFALPLVMLMISATMLCETAHAATTATYKTQCANAGCTMNSGDPWANSTAFSEWYINEASVGGYGDTAHYPRRLKGIDLVAWLDNNSAGGDIGGFGMPGWMTAVHDGQEAIWRSEGKDFISQWGTWGPSYSYHGVTVLSSKYSVEAVPANSSIRCQSWQGNGDQLMFYQFQKRSGGYALLSHSEASDGQSWKCKFCIEVSNNHGSGYRDDPANDYGSIPINDWGEALYDQCTASRNNTFFGWWIQSYTITFKKDASQATLNKTSKTVA